MDRFGPRLPKEDEMRFTYTLPETEALVNGFYCKARRKELPMEKCLNDYVEANAFENRRSACFRCPQGRKNREDFAGEVIEDD
jgi:hypothetical protein